MITVCLILLRLVLMAGEYKSKYFLFSFPISDTIHSYMTNSTFTVFPSGSTTVTYEKLEFIKPEEIADYKDSIKDKVTDKLIARVPEDVKLKLDSRYNLLKFKTEKDPDVDIWYRKTGHNAYARIRWRYFRANKFGSQ